MCLQTHPTPGTQNPVAEGLGASGTLRGAQPDGRRARGAGQAAGAVSFSSFPLGDPEPAGRAHPPGNGHAGSGSQTSGGSGSAVCGGGAVSGEFTASGELVRVLAPETPHEELPP